MNNFLKAALSYYGVDASGGHRSAFQSADGAQVLTVEINVTDDDLAGIAARMKVIQDEQVPAEAATIVPGPTDAELRQAYNAMSPAQRSAYGSFARFRAMCGGAYPYADRELREFADIEAGAPEPSEGVGGRKVQHVDVEGQADAAEMPDAVWVPAYGMANYQFDVSSEYDAVENRYLMQVAMLTPEQRTKYVQPKADEMRAGYVQRTIQARERLTGADGKPTSNADDFGGVPG